MKYKEERDRRFIADVMLGRLTRWLRLLGFDTLYFSDLSDEKLIRISKEEGRFILTRDTGLAKIKGIGNCLLIGSNDSVQQVLEVIQALDLKDFRFFSRCVSCNGQLSRLSDKAEIRDTVPDFVFLNFHTFTKCGGCGRVYWKGTHPKLFRKKLADVLRN